MIQGNQKEDKESISGSWLLFIKILTIFWADG